MGEIIQYYLSHTRGSPRKNRVNINELVRETLVLLKPIFQQHGVQVTSTLEQSLPSLQGDEASLQRVLVNILDNAVDATKEGGFLKIATRVSTSSEVKG
jgi:signal transduction histidine kinase